MSYELKVKSKSLAAEARNIRVLEGKLKDEIRSRALSQLPTGTLTTERESLHHHRTDVVRTEARATFLARAFLKGMPRHAVEAQPSPSYIMHRSFRIAKKYSPKPLEVNEYEAWMLLEAPNAGVAQSVEHFVANEEVMGS